MYIRKLKLIFVLPKCVDNKYINNVAAPVGDYISCLRVANQIAVYHKTETSVVINRNLIFYFNLKKDFCFTARTHYKCEASLV